MIAFDSNVLVRYLAQDDVQQARTASRLIDGLTPEAPGYISLVCLVETVWVLTRAYKASRQVISDTLQTLINASELIIENRSVTVLALATYKQSKADFADALIAHGASLAGCDATVTFDRLAATHAGMRLLK